MAIGVCQQRQSCAISARPQFRCALCQIYVSRDVARRRAARRNKVTHKAAPAFIGIPARSARRPSAPAARSGELPRRRSAQPMRCSSARAAQMRGARRVCEDSPAARAEVARALSACRVRARSIRRTGMFVSTGTQMCAPGTRRAVHSPRAARNTRRKQPERRRSCERARRAA